MQSYADLLKAIAALLWPLFAFVALFVFRSDIRAVLPRLKKRKLLGQEIELQESLIALETSAQKAVDAAAEVPRLASDIPVVDSMASSHKESVSERILAEAARSPKVALILLAAELEREVHNLVASLGRLSGQSPTPFKKGLISLANYGGLPSYIASSASMFYDVRSRIIHGQGAGEDEILSAIDSGLSILKALQAVPHEQHYVIDPGADVFYDAAGTLLNSKVKAVVLETRSPGGTQTMMRVFPTTRTHFRKEMRVAWEWDMNNSYPQLWYRDVASNEIKVGWGSSAEFIGRSLDEV